MESDGSEGAQPASASGCVHSGQARRMRFFAGTYSVKIDKGRFNIPSKCRELLGDDVYLYQLDNNRIQIWSVEAAESGPLADLQRDLDLHISNPSQGISYKAFSYMVSQYRSATVDSQKRILLPSEMRGTAAGGEGNRLLTGCGDHLLLRTAEDLEEAQQIASSAMARFNARYD